MLLVRLQPGRSSSQPEIHSPGNTDSGAERGRARHRGLRAECIAGEAEAGGPVHSELELQHDPRDDAPGKADQEELTEELRHPKVRVVLSLTSYAVSMAATRIESPMVSGTKIK